VAGTSGGPSELDTHRQEATVTATATFSARLTDDWLPFPAAFLAVTGWREGDSIEMEVIEGAVLLTNLSVEARVLVRHATVRAKV
jgi:hypothetical protein